MTHSCSGAALTVVLVLSVVACGGVPSAIAREDMPCVEARQAGAGDAESVCRRVYEAARREGRSEDAQRALFQLAIIARTEGQFGRAEELYAEIQRQPAFADDWKAQYRLARERGIVAHLKGDAASALTFFRGALALASEHGDQSLVGRSHNDLGNAYRHIGAQREALDAFVYSLEIKRREGDRQVGSTLNNIANLLTDLGEYERAQRYYDQALAHHLENGNEHHVAHAQEDRAHLASLQRRDDEAIEFYREAFDQFGRLQAVPDQVRVATLRASLAVEREASGVAGVEWDYADLLNYTQNIVAPPNAYNPDMYVASEAAQNYCGTYAGGGGPHWNLVPGSGSVSPEIYAPDPYSPDHYQLQDGLAFECNKCYTYAPVRRRFRLD